MQNHLRGYARVQNLLDDLRPGKPQFSIQLKPERWPRESTAVYAIMEDLGFVVLESGSA